MTYLVVTAPNSLALILSNSHSVILGYAGDPAYSVVAVVKVAVGDLNDNAPRFSGVQDGVISVSIAENKDENARIIQVTAVDADLGDNGRVTYSLTGGKSAFLVVLVLY